MIGYTGQVYDVSTGLYYYRARYYEPETGRFISQDSYRGEKEEPETLHLYSYCSNDPVNYIDPSGHKKYKKTFKVTYGKKGDKMYSYFYAKIKVDISKKKIKDGKVTEKRYKNVWYQQPVHNQKTPMYYKKKRGYKKNYWYARIAWGVVCGAQGGGISYYKVLDISVKSNRKYECFKATVPAGAYPIAWGSQKEYRDTYGKKSYESGKLK